MNNDIAISVKNISKSFRMYNSPAERLKELLHPFKRKYHKDFWALRDISFEVPKGTTIGIIGQNGCGKSTLLQIICGILQPTTGSVQVNGRISALLELGAGFNRDFTGRENVFMNGAVMGIGRKEMEERFSRIADFADIGHFIDQPVKTYSSGMYVRLAFAVAIHVDADILIVDEALSVGDMFFQAKCMAAIDQFRSQGATILFVSHSIDAVKSLCSRAIFIKKGLLIEVGKAGEVAERYIRETREERMAGTKLGGLQNINRVTKGSGGYEVDSAEKSPIPTFRINDNFEKKVALFRYGSGEVRVTDVEFVDSSGVNISVASFNQEAWVRLHLLFHGNLEVHASYYIRDDKNLLLIGSTTNLEGYGMVKGKANDKRIVEFKTRLPLSQGYYNLQVIISILLIPNESAHFVDVIENAVVFEVLQREEVRLWSKLYIENSVKGYEI